MAYSVITNKIYFEARICTTKKYMCTVIMTVAIYFMYLYMCLKISAQQ